VLCLSSWPASSSFPLISIADGQAICIVTDTIHDELLPAANSMATHLARVQHPPPACSGSNTGVSAPPHAATPVTLLVLVGH
jgi:hypothetical protein